MMDNSTKDHASAIHVAIFIFPKMMREMINNKWTPKDVLKRIEMDKGQTFMNKLTQEAKNMISNMKRNGYFALDVCCLYHVIRYFNLLSSPKQGWGVNPKSEDKRKADDVERMKILRNNIIHCPQGGLSESERKKFFEQSIEIAERMDKRNRSPMNGFKSEIEKVQIDSVSIASQEIFGKCPEYQGKLQITADKRYISLYYGNDIKMKIDAQGNQDVKRKEVTVAIIKPDAVNAGKVDQILEDIREAGMVILQQKEIRFTENDIKQIYSHLQDQDFFKDLVKFMTSDLSHVLVLTKGKTGENTIENFKDLIGPSDIKVATTKKPNSLRAKYGQHTFMNALHGSNSSKNAERELASFFPDYAVPFLESRLDKPQTTLALLRPEAFRVHKEKILTKICDLGFKVAMQKEVLLTREKAEEFYKEQKDKEYFEQLITDMTSGSVLALGLSRKNAIREWSNLLGPKEVSKAKNEAPGSLRAQFAVNDTINSLHGSDSEETAKKELQLFFPLEETVVVIKPDAGRYKDEIVNKIHEAGFKIVDRRETLISKEIAEKLYVSHQHEDYYIDLIEHMTSGPTYFVVLSREDAVKGLRSLIGPTDPVEAKKYFPDSIRAIYGESKLKNAVNGSSDLEHAEKTIKIIFGERSSACIIYLRDSNIDVNAVLQKIDDIKESIRTGNYQMKDCIELTDIKLGSLILHVTIPLKCFITKEILQKSFQTFLCQFFKAASIQSRSGPNIKVVLAESDLLFAETTNTDDLDYLNEKPSSVLNLNVMVKDTAFHSEFALHREVNRFIFGMYNTIDMHNVPVNGSAREVLMVAANESVENVYTSDDKQDPQLSFPANMSYKEDPRYAQIIVFYCDVAQYIIREFALLTIQKYKYSDWLEFLHQNIHNIYHLWKHNTTCCQCSRDSLRVSNKTQILQQKQINMLLTTDGPANPDHCIGDHEQHIEQNCLSKVSVIPTCSIESIDVSLLVILLRNCEGTKHDYEKSRDILSALIEVRNELSHAPGTELGDEKCQQLWGKLTKAILKLAEISSAETNVSVELVQRQIKECQDRCGTIEQMRKTKQSWENLRHQIVHDTVKALQRSMSVSKNDCSGVQLAETLRLEKTSLLEKLRKRQKYDEFWFVLRSPGLLEYYTENPVEKEVMPLHSINILKYTEIKRANDNTFKLVIGNKKLKLKASSEESREKWITAIQAVQNRQISKTMFNSFYLPDMPDELAEKDVTCDNSTGQPTDEVKELAPPSKQRKSVRMSELFEVPKKPIQVVAAIDFGTTFSGSAISTKSMFESNPLRVENIQLDKKKAYHKTQTSVLFKEDEFVAFGQQAERKYKTLSLKGQTDDLFYFRNFKMQLHGEKLSKSMKLRTIDGKEKSCIIVIAACIEHIKEKANERIKQMNKSIGDIDIHWVLTVPAIWSEQARQFMIKAAEKTGIDRDNLSLALEPECAAVYCKHDELVKDENEINSSLQSFKPGSRFMVVDLGGGTVDITVSEVLESGKMKEISKASGGKWGGDTINKKIVDVMNEIFGPKMNKMRTDEMNSYLELLADIESAKRDYDDEDDFTIRLPEFLQEEVNVDKLAGKFGNNIVLGKGKKHLLFSQEKMKDIFSKCISDITKHITSLLEEAIGVSEIILVGGYASSPIVQTAFREEFGQKFKLIIPQNPEIVVLTGAVISGHSKEPITGRVAKNNYGLGIRASVDPVDRNLLIGNDRHKKIFHLLIEKGRRMDVGKYVESCKIKVDDSTQLDSIELYITKSDNPEHEININNFTKIGTIKFKLPKLRKPTIFAVSLWYDETEFRVMAEDENTNLQFEGIIQYFE